MVARRGGDLGELLGGGAVLVHVPLRHHRVVGDQRHAGRDLHVLARPRDAAAAAGADPRGVAVGGGAVGEQRDPRLAGGDVAPRVGGVVLVGAAADVGGVDHLGPDPEVLGDRHARHGAGLARVVDRVDVAERQPRVLQRAPRARRLDLQRRDRAFDVARRVLVNADDRGIAGSTRHLALLIRPYAVSLTARPERAPGPGEPARRTGPPVPRGAS